MRIKIASVGEAVLRGEARPLSREEIGSANICDLIEHMRDTLSDAPGVGLAAPQIGEPLQLAIIEDKAEYQANLSEAELAERQRRPIPFHVLINPKIQLLSSPDTAFFEGCLSLPGFLGIVPRARRVSVEAWTVVGQHAPWNDAEALEPGSRFGQEGGRGVGRLVWIESGVGDPEVIVDGAPRCSNALSNATATFSPLSVLSASSVTHSRVY